MREAHHILIGLWLNLFLHTEGQQLRYAGNGIGYENVIIKGDPLELKVGL